MLKRKKKKKNDIERRKKEAIVRAINPFIVAKSYIGLKRFLQFNLSPRPFIFQQKLNWSSYYRHFP